MTTGGGWYTYHNHTAFLDENEARWVVFLSHAARGQCEYDPHGWGGIAPRGIRPRLRFSGDDYVGRLYLDVRDHWSPHTQPSLRRTGHPAVYLAVGDLPTDEQLRTTGWWDPHTHTGIRTLTGTPWSELFPPDDERTVQALSAARRATFTLSALPNPRESETPAQGIPEQKHGDS